MSTNSAVINSDKGGPTPFAMSGFALDPNQVQGIQDRIESAILAKPEDFTDITPIYWEAKRGETKVLVFMGWKQANEKNDKGEVTGERFMPVFHDGHRQIVMGQLAAVEAMLGKPMGDVYRITCEESAAGKAKKFKVEHFKG